METIQHTFHLLTSGFPHGAYQGQDHNQPDLRGPSVRGQIRWWHDALIGEIESVDVFGSIGITSQASKIVVRVKHLDTSVVRNVPFIPHKGHQGGQKAAYQPGSRFQVSISDRRAGLSEAQIRNMEKSLDAWLLLGGIGQRSNRAAGSVWPESDAPVSVDAYLARCRQILSGSRISVAVLPGAFDTEEEIRDVAGDFLADNPFQSCRTPFGSARPRKPSNLKLKTVYLDGALRLAAIWDGRFQVVEDLKRGIGILAEYKRIGELLAQVRDEF